MEIAVLALGCFWGPEIKFSKLNGIIKTEVGYCGGNKPDRFRSERQITGVQQDTSSREPVLNLSVIPAIIAILHTILRSV